MGLYLALDVGGTKTAAALGDDERILARATAGSIKTLRVPADEAAANLRAVLAELKVQSGLSIVGAVARTCIGTSGVSAPIVRSWMHAAIADSVGGELLLLGDEVIALDAAFHGGRGVLAIAGTGSNVMGRASDGSMAHTGGWGPALADEGSGHWIGYEALRACFRAIDTAAPSSADAVSVDGKGGEVRSADLPPLLQSVMQARSLATLDDVIGAANAPSFAPATVVPVVVQAARTGDRIAGGLLERAGQDLAGLISAVIHKMHVFEAQLAAPLGPPEVAFIGGILSNIAEVWHAMHQRLREQYPGIVVQQAPVDALAGAMWHARGCPGLRRGV